MPRVRRRLLVTLLSGAALAALLVIGWPYVQTAHFLARVTGQPAWLADVGGAGDVVTADVEVPTRHGRIAARHYRLRSTSAPGVLIVPGVHAGGVDEPRLDRFARRVAAAGARVVSLPLPDLRRFLITPASTDQIEDAIAWMSAQPDLAAGGRLGLVGVSFGGGLSMVAAGRARVRDRLTSVVSIGGYGDLPRVLRFLCSAAGGDETVAPHDYGLAVLALGAVDHLVPPGQGAAVSDVLRDFLVASSLAGHDPDGAAARFGAASARARRLDDPGRTLVEQVLARDAAAVGSRLLPLVDDLGGDPSLSPERSPLPTAPVFLLHGTTDNVIPASETRRLARHLAAHGSARVRWLITPAFSHADVSGGVGLADAWALVRFWTAVRAAR